MIYYGAFVKTFRVGMRCNVEGMGGMEDLGFGRRYVRCTSFL